MIDFNLRVKVGSALRPEDFPTRDFIEIKIEEAVLLSLQTLFDFVEAVTTDMNDNDDDASDEPYSGDQPPTGGSDMPKWWL